ncbi:AraC family transcriptional regulator [Ilyomonas limi]|uniref:AraC family transcriptional regulator n=1 Tax=Ilyomonas limi TaxID=2575867 RepID=A0A4U3KRU0_9BACT|nr:AraC family transcriptional regulator [Ilyomonas limi]TKK65145.1 AraC family transcriptional regulator [Ilyomonas limi]
MKPHFKPIPTDDSNLFKAVLQENAKEFDYPWHFHPEYELTYIATSQGTRYVGNSIENFSEDDLVLIGANLPHCWINSPNQQQAASALVVYFKEDFVDKSWMNSGEFGSIRNLLELSNKGIKFHKSVALKLKEKIFELHKLPSLDRLILILKILQELAETKERHFLCEQGFSYELNHTNNERINKVYKYIEKNYQKKIALTDIARQVNMTEESFSRFFSKTMKKSFFEFLNEYKINKACKSLIETDKQINEICYASGFESIPFFYRQFKKFKNCQPKNYRMYYQKM